MYAHPDLAADFSAQQDLLTRFVAGAQFAPLIDSTVLKVETTRAHLEKLCVDAIQYAFRAVCVPPDRVGLVRELLAGTKNQVRVCTVIGFPNGYAATKVKVFEVALAVSEGADEVDFVQNVGLVKEERWYEWEEECRLIVAASAGKLVKIILETSLLSEKEIYECAERAALQGVHVIKTSTGFGVRGASESDLMTISKALEVVQTKTGRRHGIKASGGVRSTQDAWTFVRAGATRLGTSGGVAILTGQVNTEKY